MARDKKKLEVKANRDVHESMTMDQKVGNVKHSVPCTCSSDQ